MTASAAIPFRLRPEVLEPAESCGCTVSHHGVFAKHRKDLAEQLEFASLLQSSGMIQKLSAPDNLMAFARKLHHVLYLIRRIKVFYFCICDDWDGISNTSGDTYRTTGYSDSVFLFRQVYGSSSDEMVHLRELPEIIRNPEKPTAYHFVPCTMEDRCFGFLAVEFEGEQYSLDKQLHVDGVRQLGAGNHADSELHPAVQRTGTLSTSIRDPLTGIYNRRGFEEPSSEI
ncbi:MAG: hypothetical protein ACLUSL_10505 [Ruminococcus sp.]